MFPELYLALSAKRYEAYMVRQLMNKKPSLCVSQVLREASFCLHLHALPPVGPASNLFPRF